ncbi:MAG: peptidoglycan editing factor PgeF [Clostridia bacterium]|nr:peptidoglycan editing factor PgeF [Clostridia bacterium]
MHFVTAPNGVCYLRSDAIALPHGFSTRIGGVSTLPHTASLNLAFGRGDDDAVVLANLDRFTEAVGVPAEVISLPQIHSADVRVVGENDRGLGCQRPADGSCDGYVTTSRGVTVGVKTADCVPILLADETAGIIAALHAGWRGTAAGIAREGVRKMVALGAHPSRIKAAIGPAIGPCCYAVGEDFLAAVSAFPCADLCLPHITRRAGQNFADLSAMNTDILLAEGLLPAQIDTAGLCTCCDTEHFYSHRASHGLRGTMMAVIALPKGE